MKGCGASYAFAAIDAIESRMMIGRNRTIGRLSEQQVIDCLPEGESWRKDKCTSGTEIEVFEFAKTNGVLYEKLHAYDFTGYVNTCRTLKGDFRIRGYSRVRPFDPP